MTATTTLLILVVLITAPLWLAGLFILCLAVAFTVTYSAAYVHDAWAGAARRRRR